MAKKKVTEGSKLAELLKKSQATAKKPVNFDKFAKELQWSSDELSDSDLDILEESDDGIVYAENSEEDMIEVEDFVLKTMANMRASPMMSFKNKVTHRSKEAKASKSRIISNIQSNISHSFR